MGVYGTEEAISVHSKKNINIESYQPLPSVHPSHEKTYSHFTLMVSRFVFVFLLFHQVLI